MGLIQTRRLYRSRHPNPRPLLLLSGFGGKVWQLRRLITVLNDAGYDVTALDFPKSVLSKGDVTLLPALVEDVKQFADEFARVSQEPTLLVGVSLGALLALNIVRSSPFYKQTVLITGGDIAKIAKKLYPKQWPQSYEVLAEQWKNINMYSEPEELRGKHLLFVLHPSSKLIDARDTYHEIERQRQAGNHLVMVERTRWDHIGTIIDETILHPKRTLDYIEAISLRS